MKGTQDEIQAIQARLQAINARETGYRPATATSMIEVFPANRPNSAPLRGADGGGAATADPLAAGSATLQWPIAATASAPLPAQVAPPVDRPTSPLTERAVLGQLDETWKQLTIKAEHINHLASAQESALLELRAIAQRLERDWRATGLEQFPYPETSGDFSSLYGQGVAEVPWVERDEAGNYILASRTLDLLKAEREALRVAQDLRKRRVASETSLLTPAGQALWGWFEGLVAGRSQGKAPRAGAVRGGSRGRRRLATPEAIAPSPDASLSLTTGAIWLVGATVARMAIDALLVSHPALWLPALAVIVAPAAIAAYRTTVAPETSIQWGYRLLLTMVGLLLGGRL